MDGAVDTTVGGSLPVSPRTVAVPFGQVSSKARSLSDPPTAPSMLAPSPDFQESLCRTSKDDHAVPTTPRRMRRSQSAARGLSLQMPQCARDMLSPAHVQAQPAPLSPQLDQHETYSFVHNQSQAASPATSLPRHSRGLDFSRACTTLHHSTLAEQSSPDLSPLITQKAMSIPSRKMSVSSMALDSPNMMVGGPWGSLVPERSTVSSSVGSANMLVSESESDDSDDDASMGGDENDDPIFATPQVHKLQNPSAPTPFAGPQAPSATPWIGASANSPAAASLLRTIRKSRLQKVGRKTKQSSSSASNSGYNSTASPRAASPPPMRSIEGPSSAGYFGWAKSRRGSLAHGTDSLQLSSGNDSGDEGLGTAPPTPGVVRRPVTRRGSLLPKTKGFARIRATLADEAFPVDTETRREAETIRQVRERDNSVTQLDLTEPHHHTATAPSSPGLLPAVPESAQEDLAREIEADNGPAGKGLCVNFSLHASRNNSGANYWNRFDPSLRTPPPLAPPAFGRNSSSLTSDFTMESPLQPGGGPGDAFQRVRGRAPSAASDISDAMTMGGNSHTGPPAGINDDMHLKKFKRRREDDFDISTIKRRAVSPGLSAQNSPVLTQSPLQRDSSWGQPPERRKDKEVTTGGGDGGVGPSQHPPVGRSSSNGSNGTPGPIAGLAANQGKKLGLQGMVDTNDGLMKMSIE